MPASSLGMVGWGEMGGRLVNPKSYYFAHSSNYWKETESLPSPLSEPCLDKEPNTKHRITDLFNLIQRKTPILINESNQPCLLSTHFPFSQWNISGYVNHSLSSIFHHPTLEINSLLYLPIFFLKCDTEKGWINDSTSILWNITRYFFNILDLNILTQRGVMMYPWAERKKKRRLIAFARPFNNKQTIPMKILYSCVFVLIFLCQNE